MKRTVEGGANVERELRLWHLVGSGRSRRWLAVRRDVCLAVETHSGLSDLLGVVMMVNNMCELASVAASGAPSLLKRLALLTTPRQRELVTARRASAQDIALCRFVEARLDAAVDEKEDVPCASKG